MRRGGFVQGHDVLAMSGLISFSVLGWRLEGGAALFVTSIVLGLMFYAGVMLARQRLHLELGVIGALFLSGFIIGGGHLLARALPGPWARLFVMTGPPVVLAFLWAFSNRERSE